MVTEPFDTISLGELRKRTSEKWTTYPPDILPAFVAEMDFPLAPSIREALAQAVERSDSGYAGTTDLAAAFRDFARRAFEWTVDERSVIALPDVMAGVTEALHALTPAGAGVAINPPVYPPFFEVIRNAGRQIVEVPLRHDAQQRYRLDLDRLENVFAAGARAYLLCSPHNPVGRVWSRDDLSQIAALARKYGVVVIADEIHAPLTMPGKRFVPFLTVAQDDVNCVALLSASKAWNIAGLKCAVAVAGPSVRSALNEHVKKTPTSIRDRIGQFGALASAAAFRDESPWLDELRSYLDANRCLLRELLAANVPAVRYELPQATYLGWIDCGEVGFGQDPARAFLERGRVALEAGYKFGTGGERFVRLNFGTSQPILREIVGRMKRAL